MRNIGDVDTELEAAILEAPDIHRVVEVAGGRRINRDGVPRPEIVTARGNPFRRAFRGVSRLPLPRSLERMLGNPNFRMMAMVSTLGSSSNPITLTIFPAGHVAAHGISRDLDFHDLVFVLRCIFGDEDFRRQLLIHGSNEEDLPVKTKLPDDGPLTRFVTLTTRPSVCLPGLCRTISICTLSPFIAEPVIGGGMKTSLPRLSTFSSGMTKPYPSRCSTMVPSIKFLDLAS